MINRRSFIGTSLASLTALLFGSKLQASPPVTETVRFWDNPADLFERVEIKDGEAPLFLTSTTSPSILRDVKDGLSPVIITIKKSNFVYIPLIPYGYAGETLEGCEQKVEADISRDCGKVLLAAAQQGLIYRSDNLVADFANEFGHQDIDIVIVDDWWIGVDRRRSEGKLMMPYRMLSYYWANECNFDLERFGLPKAFANREVGIAVLDSSICVAGKSPTNILPA